MASVCEHGKRATKGRFGDLFSRGLNLMINKVVSEWTCALDQRAPTQSRSPLAALGWR
jgi:hypothetical protein